MRAETPSCFSHQHFLTESYASRPLTGDPSLIPPYGDRAKRKWLSDEELPGTADEIGRCGDQNGHAVGNQVREVHRLAREHKILARDELCRKCRRPCRASYTCNHSRGSEEGRNRFARREAVQIGKIAGRRCWGTIEVNRKGAGSEERGR